MNYLTELADTFIQLAPFLMLGLLVAGILHILIDPSFIVRHIGKANSASVFKSALLGVPLPLCSCGVIPTALYLKKSGASQGAVLSFLISTPQTGVDSLAATYGVLGPFFALFRAAAALITGTAGGMLSLLGMKKSRKVEKINYPTRSRTTSKRSLLESIQEVFHYGFREQLDDISLHLVIGILLAAALSLILPDDFFMNKPWANGLPGMLLMILIGTPLYICSTSSIPIAAALMAKGLSPGAAYVFLIAGPATNMASLTVLLKTLGRRETLIFLFTVIIGSLAAGLFMDAIVPFIPSEFLPTPAMIMTHHEETSFISLILSLLLALLMAYSLGRTALSRLKKPSNASTTILIDGMNCQNCANHVSKALSEISGITDVTVDIKKKTAAFKGSAPREQLKETIATAGYSLREDDSSDNS